MPIILRLDRMMAHRKISLNQLAREVGITSANLSNIKTGKISAIRFSTLDAICRVLQCQPGDILEYQPEEAPISFTNTKTKEELSCEAVEKSSCSSQQPA